MIAIKNIRNVYLIGIGGIGMSALARYFHQKGAHVSGYDRTSTPLTQQLETSGIHIHYQEDLEKIDKHAGLVIYTPAIPKDNIEWNYYIQRQYPVFKRSEVLQMIVKDMFCITVAGTHGKTTISTLIAHILRDSGYGCNAFLGGISNNYHTNYWSHERKVAVIEADEYDHSFLKLEPDIAVLTAMDADHLDIYKTPEAMQDAYIQYTKQIKPHGALIYKYGLIRSSEMNGSHKITYSLNKHTANVYACNIATVHGGYDFDIVSADWEMDKVHIQSGGIHNIENTVAAVAVVHQLGIEPSKIKPALVSFKGVKRRFEYVIKSKQQIFIDDYAHHPEELKTLISSAKALFPEKDCTIIFQPHLYSRTMELAPSFAKELSRADKVILLPIYPAREKPIPGIDSKIIADRMSGQKADIFTKAETLSWLKDHQPGLLITAGAGDISEMVQPIKKLLEENFEQ